MREQLKEFIRTNNDFRGLETLRLTSMVQRRMSRINCRMEVFQCVTWTLSINLMANLPIGQLEFDDLKLYLEQVGEGRDEFEQEVIALCREYTLEEGGRSYNDLLLELVLSVVTETAYQELFPTKNLL